MKQKDKDLLLLDLCSRLPYGVKLQNINNIESIVKLRSIDLDDYCCEIIFYTYQGKALTICDKSKIFRFGKILRYKPYLFPLSSMTEEQRNELKGLLRPSVLKSLDEEDGDNEDIEFPTLISANPSVVEIDYYNKNHFDYRGLIEKGLALDANGLNIY